VSTFTCVASERARASNLDGDSQVGIWVERDEAPDCCEVGPPGTLEETKPEAEGDFPRSVDSLELSVEESAE